MGPVNLTEVQVVFFDLDGTLIFHEPDSMDVIARFCAGIGQPLGCEQERMGRRVRHEYFVDPVIRDQIAGLSTAEFWHHFNRHLLEAMQVRGDLDALADRLTAQFDDVDLAYQVPDEVWHTLDGLRSRGYLLGLLTNRENVSRFYELLDTFDLRRHFDVALSSGEVGQAKPHPAIFVAALDQIGAAAARCIYVGDNYWADVIGAERAGLRPILIDPLRLFPEAECLILERLDDLLAWLPGMRSA
ncbi:MAG: HAD family hydrolase [Anaerolineae bacterium]|nr:HAD family hydrolase [Anaerolineae bacterium]